MHSEGVVGGSEAACEGAGPVTPAWMLIKGLGHTGGPHCTLTRSLQPCLVV